MVKASGVSASLDSEAVPLLPGAEELANTERFPGGSHRNLQDTRSDVIFPEAMPEARRLLLADAQTSGGLLVAVPPEALDRFLELAEEDGPRPSVIGEITEGPAGRILVR
jgi:selenide,water dikinase